MHAPRFLAAARVTSARKARFFCRGREDRTKGVRKKDPSGSARGYSDKCYFARRFQFPISLAMRYLGSRADQLPYSALHYRGFALSTPVRLMLCITLRRKASPLRSPPKWSLSSARDRRTTLERLTRVLRQQNAIRSVMNPGMCRVP